MEGKGDGVDGNGREGRLSVEGWKGRGMKCRGMEGEGDGGRWGMEDEGDGGRWVMEEEEDGGKVR